MPSKNSTIKFLAITEEKEQADKIATDLSLNHSECYEMIFNLGLTELKSKLMNQKLSVVITHSPDTSCKRINFNRKK